MGCDGVGVFKQAGGSGKQWRPFSSEGGRIMNGNISAVFDSFKYQDILQ